MAGITQNIIEDEKTATIDSNVDQELVQNVNKTFKLLSQRQKPLGKNIDALLYSNRWKLYDFHT